MWFSAEPKKANSSKSIDYRQGLCWFLLLPWTRCSCLSKAHVSSTLCEGQHCEKSQGVSGASDLIHRFQSCHPVISRKCGERPSLQKITNVSEISPLFKRWIQTTRSEWSLSSLKVQNSLFQGFAGFVCRQNCCFSECDLMVPWFTHSSTGTMTTPNSAMLVKFNLSSLCQPHIL